MYGHPSLKLSPSSFQGPVGDVDGGVSTAHLSFFRPSRGGSNFVSWSHGPPRSPVSLVLCRRGRLRLSATSPLPPEGIQAQDGVVAQGQERSQR